MPRRVGPEKRCPKCDLVKSRAEGFWHGQSWCKECQKGDWRRWRAANPGRANEINRKSREKRRPKVLAYLRDHYQKNRQRKLVAARQRHHALKDATYAAYGGYRCACCGETQPEFLCIDHVNNDGHAHRKSIGRGANIYLWLKKNGYPAGFQVLCMNCNFGKKHNGGVCPHVAAQYGIEVRIV